MEGFVMTDKYTLIKNKKVVSFKPKVENIFNLLRARSNRLSDKDAIVYFDLDKRKSHKISYKQLFEITKRVISYLKDDLKLKRGGVISLSMNNSPEIIIFYLAAWSCGLIVAPLSSKTDSLQTKLYKLSKVKSRCLFINSSQSCFREKEIKEIRKEFRVIDVMDLGNWTFSEVSNKKPDKYNNYRSSLSSPGLILYTSGTTGKPKGVILTPYSLIANADSILEWLALTERDRFHIILPLSHINSTVFSLAMILVGGSIILSSRYSKRQYWKVMKEFSATCSSIVPTIAYDLVKDTATKPSFVRKLGIKRIQIGSAPVRPGTCLEFYKKYSIRLVQGYGQTETSLRSTGLPINLKKDEYLSLVKINSIGTELKWTNVTILKLDGSEAEEGEQGEIGVRGPILTQGYFNNLRETKKSFTNGWFHSGDWGYYKVIKGRKHFFTNGRVKELIIKGGVNISPLSVENALISKYPEVSSAYSFAFPDDRYGEVVASVILFKNSLSKKKRVSLLKKIVRDGKKGKIEGLSDYESPSCVFELDGADLPRTVTGKIQRARLKDFFVSGEKYQ